MVIDLWAMWSQSDVGFTAAVIYLASLAFGWPLLYMVVVIRPVSHTQSIDFNQQTGNVMHRHVIFPSPALNHRCWKWELHGLHWRSRRAVERFPSARHKSFSWRYSRHLKRILIHRVLFLWFSCSRIVMHQWALADCISVYIERDKKAFQQAFYLNLHIQSLHRTHVVTSNPSDLFCLQTKNEVKYEAVSTMSVCKKIVIWLSCLHMRFIFRDPVG